MMIFHSESVGPVTGLHCMQCRRRRLLFLMFFPVPGAVAEAAQIRDSVSFPRIWIPSSWPWLAPRAAPGSRAKWFRCRWSVGSLLFLLSWAVLMGPFTYAKHLVSGSRLPFTAAYFGSIALTLYFAVGVSILFLMLLSSLHPPCLWTSRPGLSHGVCAIHGFMVSSIGRASNNIRRGATYNLHPIPRST